MISTQMILRTLIILYVRQIFDIKQMIPFDASNAQIFYCLQQIDLKQLDMGSGCLNPPSKPINMDLTILDSIYEDIKQMNLPSYCTQQRASQIYEEIKDRISKKGQLKKLCDYLSSHRYRICQILLHTNRVTSQGKMYYFKFVAVLVLEGIFNAVPVKKNRTNAKLNNESKVTTAFENNRSFKAVSTPKNSTFNNIEENQSFGVLESTKKSQFPLQNDMQQQSAELPSHASEFASAKFQSIYLNLMTILLHDDGLIYRLSLQNLSRYCQILNSATSANYKFGNEGQIQEIMKIIYYHIQVSNELDCSLKCYKMMLSRVKEGYFMSNIQCMRGFFELWVSDGHRTTFQQASSYNNTALLLQPDPLPTPSSKSQELTNSEVSQNCFQILSLFVQSSIQNYQSASVLEEMFYILDKFQFENRHVRKMQALVFDSNQLQNQRDDKQFWRQFYRSLMAMLLGYVGYVGKVNTTSLNGFPSFSYSHGLSKMESHIDPYLQKAQQQQTIAHSLKQWLQCFNLPFSFPKRFKNILSLQSKLHALPLIYRWLFQEQAVEVNQILTYSCEQMLNAYVFNIWYSPDRLVRDKAVSQLKTLLGKLRPEQFIRVGQKIMKEIHQSQMDENLRYIMMDIYETCILSNIKQADTVSLQQFSQTPYMILPLRPDNSLQTSIKTMSINKLILSKISKEAADKNLEQICDFLHSLHMEIGHGFSNGDNKIKINNAFGEIFGRQNNTKDQEIKSNKVISPRSKFDDYSKGIFIAFLENINKSATKKQLDERDKNDTIVTTVPESHFLFVDYLMATVAGILNVPIVNQHLSSYINKFTNAGITQQLQILDEYNNDRVPIRVEELIMKIKNNTNTRMGSKKLPPIGSVRHQQEEKDMEFYEQSTKIFTKKQSFIKQQEHMATQSVLWKRPNSVCEESRVSSHTHRNEGEIDDVLDIIRND